MKMKKRLYVYTLCIGVVSVASYAMKPEIESSGKVAAHPEEIISRHDFWPEDSNIPDHYAQRVWNINNALAILLEADKAADKSHYLNELKKYDNEALDKAFRLYLHYIANLISSNMLSRYDAYKSTVLLLNAIQEIMPLSSYMLIVSEDFKLYISTIDTISESEKFKSLSNERERVDFLEDALKDLDNQNARIPQSLRLLPPDRGGRWIYLVKHVFESNTIALHILHDDVDAFMNSFVNTNASVNDLMYIYTLSATDFERRQPVKLIDFTALTGAVKCFKYLLLNGAAIGHTTFTMAVAGENAEIIHLLNSTDCEKNYINAFVSAIVFHRFEIAKWLLLKGYVDIKDIVSRRSDVWQFVNCNDILKALIQNRTTQQVQDAKIIIKEMIDAINLHSINRRNEQPSEMILLFMQIFDIHNIMNLSWSIMFDIMVSGRDDLFELFTYEATEYETFDYPYKLDYLIKNLPNINIVNLAKKKNGKTLLHQAVSCVNLDDVKFLVENGADINARDSAGETPLGAAVRENNRDSRDDTIEMIDYLKANGAKM